LTLATTFGGSALAMGGGDKKEVAPPIKAESTDEEKFILYAHLPYPSTFADSWRQCWRDRRSGD
jgi:hypothetical protein